MLVEPISREHDRKAFDCGDEEVTRFLREQALQGQEKNLSRATMLDARNERLARWYEEHDFSRFPSQVRMFKSIEAIRALDLI